MNRKSYLYFTTVLAAILLLLFSAWLPAQTVTLKFVETTDVHGAIFPYDFINDKEMPGSLAQVHSYVQKERNKTQQEVILLSAGDILQGQPTVYYFNFEKPDVPHLYARVMNYMQYDAGAVGNHDIETGHAVYDKFTTELNFPWLAANAVKTTDSEPYFPPYTVIERRGIRIAILGMVTPGIPNWLPEKLWSGMRFEDMVETARKWVPIIEKQENPDLLVGLLHSGVDFTYGGQTRETPKNENASQLVAELVPGFDIIFVGHDHRGWNVEVEAPKGRMVRLVGASANAIDAAVATVTMKRDPKTNTWQKTISGDIIDITQFPPDMEFMETFSKEMEEVKTYVSRRIGRFTSSVSTRSSLFGDSEFVDLIHAIQLQLTGADLSVAAPLSFDAMIEQGDVFVRDMFNLYKYENFLYTMSLSGHEVDGFLEFSYAGWFNQMVDSSDHLLRFATDENGNFVKSKRNQSYQLKTPSFNYDSMAGLIYTVDVSKLPGERVTIHGLRNGGMFDENKTYTVAVNSYRGNGGGGHLTAGSKIPTEELSDRILSATDKDLRFYMMRWIEQQQEVTPKAFDNWKVIPQNWWQSGKTRDYQLLFGEIAGSN